MTICKDGMLGELPGGCAICECGWTGNWKDADGHHLPVRPPPPQWHAEPPTEPGNYFWSEKPGRAWSDIHRVDSRGPWSMRRGHLVRDGLWWPVPLTPPPLPEA